jgi:hypothetical protein
MQNSSIISSLIANNNNVYDDKTATTSTPVAVNSNEASPLQEFGRYLGINVIGIVAIVLVMTFCYLSHVFYNNAWKPFKMYDINIM